VRFHGKEAEYRGFATLCLKVANKSQDAGDKTRLLVMAEAWRDLADRTSRLAKQAAAEIADHPLVAEALGRYGVVESEKAGIAR
jgi:hypothetical protein